MKKFKTIKIPYDKEAEERIRKEYQESSYKSFKYPSCAKHLSTLKKIDKDGKKISVDISDEGQGEREIYSQIDFELLIVDLPNKEKEAVELKNKECLSREDIARKMGIKENAVKQLLFRGYKKIKSKVEKSQDFNYE